jgi:hypothetical protein
MTRPYPPPLTLNRRLTDDLRAIQSVEIRDEAARQTLGTLLQEALQLEFATVPTYLSAAFSLTSNEEIYLLSQRAAVEEMLHMATVANLMNAIGIAPDIRAAAPEYPHELTVLQPSLTLNLKSFSLDLVEKLFMHIETPEDPVDYPATLDAVDRPATIGQFYAGVIDIIASDTIPDLFGNAVRDAYKQRALAPNFRPIAYLNNDDTGNYPLKPDIDFKITDKTSAVRHLSWVVGQGEGSAPFDPLTAEGIPGHFYRFESILKRRYLVKDAAVPNLGYSYSGGDLPFDPAGVHEFDVNAKARDYAAFPAVATQMKRFNDKYTKMINLLHDAFNCPSEDKQQQALAAYNGALGIMRDIGNAASNIILKAQASGIKGGIPFEYAGPNIA